MFDGPCFFPKCLICTWISSEMEFVSKQLSEITSLRFKCNRSMTLLKTCYKKKTSNKHCLRIGIGF